MFGDIIFMPGERHARGTIITWTDDNGHWKGHVVHSDETGCLVGYVEPRQTHLRLIQGGLAPGHPLND